MQIESVRRSSARLCVLLSLVTASVALIQLVPAYEQSQKDEHAHSECSAVNPPADMFKRLVNAHANANANDRKRRSLASASVPQPIRFTTVYDSSFNTMQSSTYLKQLVGQAIASLERALIVRHPSSAPLTIARSCQGCTTTCPNDCSTLLYCYGVNIPQQYLETCNVCSSNGTVTGTVGGTGASNTDYLLFVAALSSGCSASTVAYATACEIDYKTLRPNVGMLNLCAVTNSQGALQYDPDTTVRIIAHEITHALGFISSLFAFFVDDYGAPYAPFSPNTGLPYTDTSGNYIWSDKVAVKKSVMWQTASGYVPVNKTYIVTPTVVNFVRQFFNCSSLIGAELEDQGGAGTALSHWEKRIFVNEFMAGVITEQMYISALTLSLLQDSGWYYANFSAAETYTWGQGLGCSFANQSCLTWINDKVAAGQNPYPFCNTFDKWSSGEVRTTCDPQQQAIRRCNLDTYSSTISAQYAYFKQPIANAPSSNPAQYGGYIEVADYCPYYASLTLSYSTSQYNFYGTCNNPFYSPPSSSNYALEAFESRSLCLRQKTPTFLYQCSSYLRTTRWGSGCYPVTCSSTSVTINVNGQVLTCTSELQTLSWTPTVAQLSTQFSYLPTLVAGTIVCPQCDNACPNKYCPMQRVQANSTTLLNTDQTNSATTPSTVPSNIPCTSVWSTGLTTVSVSTVCPNCSLYANCNPVGSTYYCVCKTGYYGNGQSCTALIPTSNLVLQTNVSLPIDVSQSDVLNTSSNTYLLVKKQLDQTFDSALSTMATYTSGSATVTKVYSGSLIVQLSAVFSSAYSSQNAEAPAYLTSMNNALVNTVSSQGSNCSIGSFTNVNCTQASVTSSNQDACAYSACPAGTTCSATTQFQYVCVCPSGFQLPASQASVALYQNCNFYSYSKASASVLDHALFTVVTALIYLFTVKEQQLLD